MRKSLPVFVLASAIAGGLAVAPLHAEEATPPTTSPKGSDMMGDNDMMGMMNMLTQMTQMMETCNKMMQASMDKDHGTNGKPAMPEKKG